MPALTGVQLDRAVALHTLTAKGRAVVDQIRSATEPARKVRGGRSIVVRYPSVVMNRVLAVESRNFELPVASWLDNDPQTSAIYAQPVRLEVLTKKPGMLRAGTTTVYPDFFAIQTLSGKGGQAVLSMRFISAKAAEEMKVLAEAEPDRYSRGEDGRWHDLLLEQYAREQLGIDAETVTDADLPAYVTRNETFLRDYRRIDGVVTAEVPPHLHEQALEIVRTTPSISGRALRERCPGLTVDMVNQMVADGEIWFDRRSELLKDDDRVRFYVDKAIGLAVLSLPVPRALATRVFDIAAGSSFTWGGRTFKIMHLKEDSGREHIVDVLTSDGDVQAIRRAALEKLFDAGDLVPQQRPANPASPLRNMSKMQERRFLARHQKLEAATAAGKPLSSTERRWRRNQARDGVVALVPRFNNSGRHGPRRSEEDRALALRVLGEQFLAPEQRTLRLCHGMYVREFDRTLKGSDASAAAMSRPTFDALLHQTWSNEEIAAARFGYKEARSVALRGPLAGGRVDGGLPVRGDRAYERGHLDHTEWDLWLVDSVTGETIGRLWSSSFVDAYTDKLLALEFSFDNPSKRLPMQIVRSLVRTYHRLPSVIVTDNGSEFKSTYWQVFCAEYGIQMEYRPPGNGRSGSPVEAMNHRVNSVLHALVGNARPGQDPRSLDKALGPDKRALWTLAAVERDLKPRIVAYINGREDPITGKSPDRLFAESMASAGTRPSRLIAYDQAFIIQSALPRRDELTVDRSGVTVGPGIAYWSEAFRDNKVQGTKVQVRDEPYDVSTKYALVNDEWVICRSERFRDLEGRTPLEVEIASKEIAARLGREPSISELVDAVVAMQTVESRLADEQREMRRGYSIPEGGSEADADPAAPADPFTLALEAHNKSTTGGAL